MMGRQALDKRTESELLDRACEYETPFVLYRLNMPNSTDYLILEEKRRRQYLNIQKTTPKSILNYYNGQKYNIKGVPSITIKTSNGNPILQ